MIGSMNLHMAILTTAVHEPGIGTDATGQVGSSEQIIGMASVDMTLLA